MNKRILFATLVTLTVLISCKKEKKESNFIEFAPYISSYSESDISATSNFKLVMNKPFDASLVSEKLFSIKPKISGEVSVDENVISFKPDNTLEAKKEYQITFHLSKLYKGIPSNLKDFVFKTKVKELLFSVSIQSQQVYDKNWNYIEGLISASDIMPTEKLKKVLIANYEGKELPIKFLTTEKIAQQVHFKIDSIKRQEEDTTLKLLWNGEAIGSKSADFKNYTIAGKNNFKVLDINVFDGKSQHIEISFSDALKKSQNLKGLIQITNTPKTKYTYKINNNILSIYPSARIKKTFNLNIFRGIKNTDGYTLKEDILKNLYFEQLKPKINFVKSGTILPNSNNLKINFQAVNLKAVDVTVYKIYKENVLQFLQNNSLKNTSSLRYVGRPQTKYTVNLSEKGLNLSRINAFAIDLADMVEIEEGAMYRVKLSYNKKYSSYNCNSKKTNDKIKYGKQKIDDSKYNQTGYYYNDEYDEYNWSERNDPCKNSYYVNKSIETNVLATNLGVIVKKGSNNDIFVAVSDILTTKPVENADITIYNLQKQKIKSAKTNTNGFAFFENLNQAFFAKITRDKNVTYVKLDDGNSLSMSKFDVSGIKLQKGIKGYIYGERGVWRPGDQIFMTFVMNDKANPIPERHPIKFELTNPQGKIVDREVLYKNPTNVYTYAPKTNQDALTGNWRMKVSVGGAKFSKNLKIETIKPNRLKIKLISSEKEYQSKEIKASLEVKWLHGAIAKSLKYDVNGKFRQTKTSFKNFKNYQFDDVTNTFGTEEYSVANGKLNDKGKTEFSLNTKNLKLNAPGKLKVSFITKVYEEGGDFSTDVHSKTFSPYSTYVGLETPKEPQSNYYLHTDKAYNFKVATVSENGKEVPVNNLNVTVYKLNWRWWWSNSNDGLANYNGAEEITPYKSLTTSTNNSGKGSFSLKIDKNDWGRFLVKVSDKKGKHTTSKIVYFDWPSWYGSKNNSSSEATMLVFATNKKEYNVNEMAKLKIPSSAGGRALITIENGTEVLDYFWTETQEKQTEFEFKVSNSYTPNVFVNVSLLQKHNQTKNNLPIRMYGSTPILVSDPNKKLNPQIIMDNEVRPEQIAKIQIKEKDGKPMTYTIAMVDEGLLDLTRFKTPNPYNSFYARQSLGVKTWDIFDDVVGAYGGKINQILSIGGDETEAGSKNKKADRFKPMVRYLGPFELKAGAKANHQIEIPQYVGSVRTMVVASNTETDAYGSTEKNTFVRKPLMILASLPRKITPNETVTLPVTVFAMKPGVKNVSVSLKENQSFTIIGNKTQKVNFSQPDEKMTYFKLKVNEFNGIGKVDVIAKSGNELAKYSVEIDVINPNPVTTEVKEAVLTTNKSTELDFLTFGTAGTNSADIELSVIPPINFTKRMQYLIRFPHGCVEQITSGVFPQLFLNDLFDLSEEKKKQIERNIKAGINKLSKFQKSNGGLSYWQGGNYISDWGTSYVGHFMVEATKKGYALPIGFKSKWVSYQKQTAKNWRARSYDSGLEQAYRLYTLALAKAPDLASMNRLRETPNTSAHAKIRLAATYAIIGKSSIAQTILNAVSEPEYNQKSYYGYGSAVRDKALALETYTLVNNEKKAVKLAKEIAKELSSNNWMSTQTTAYSLLSIANYAMQNGVNKGIKTKFILNGATKDVQTNKSLYTSEFLKLKKNNKVIIKNNGEGTLYARVFVKGILPVGNEKTIQRGLLANVQYTFTNNKPVQPDVIKQGTNFKAKITIKNTTNKRVENVALTQILPSGWEIINSRFTDFGNTQSAEVDYTDIKDDRVNYYFSIKGNESKTFQVLINASYLGNYYLPGLQCEAMYDNDYTVRTRGKWIKVVE